MGDGGMLDRLAAEGPNPDRAEKMQAKRISGGN
jgi:hypothetical protein